jgi:hypothetical protein
MASEGKTNQFGWGSSARLVISRRQRKPSLTDMYVFVCDRRTKREGTLNVSLVRYFSANLQTST